MQTTFTSSPCSRCRHFQLRRTAQCKINEPADVFVVQFFRTRRRVRRKAAAAAEKKQKQAELLRQWLKFIVSSSCPTRCFFFHLRLPPLVSGFFSAGLIKKKKKKIASLRLFLEPAIRPLPLRVYLPVETVCQAPEQVSPELIGVTTSYILVIY